MKLIPIDYNGGQIWVDLSSKDFTGKTIYCHGEVFPLTKWDGEGEGFMSIVIAQSTNLSLPNIPYVEIEEANEVEAEKRAKKFFTKETCGNHEYSEHSALCAQLAYVRGWNSASAKKYTEEDLKKAWELGYSFVAVGEGNLEEYIQSLQPKVVSIEIEMEDIKEFMSEETIQHPFDKDRAKQLWDKYQPYKNCRTYQKDAKTFLKVKSVQYEVVK